jgi:hypothetical protein
MTAMIQKRMRRAIAVSFTRCVPSVCGSLMVRSRGAGTRAHMPNEVENAVNSPAVSRLVQMLQVL